MNVYNVPIATAQAMNANFNSKYEQVYEMIGYYVQAVVTNTPNGTFVLQASGDPINQVGGPVNWSTITNSSTAAAAATVYAWNITGAFYNFVRVQYTDSSSGSSTATCTILFNAKSY
jgi:hypothetical protein